MRLEPSITEGDGPRPRFGEHMAGDSFRQIPGQVEVENNLGLGIVDPSEDAVFFEQADALDDLGIELLIEARRSAAGDLRHDSSKYWPRNLATSAGETLQTRVA